VVLDFASGKDSQVDHKKQALIKARGFEMRNDLHALLLAVLCVAACSSIESEEERLIWQNPNYQPRIKEIGQFCERSFAVVILGNSITYGGDWPQLLQRDDVLNMGIGSDITAGFLQRLDLVMQVNPHCCCIMGGINDLYDDIPVNRVAENLATAVERLQEHGIEPILHAVLAVSPRWREAELHNRRVRKLNQQLRRWAVRRQIAFVDLNPVLAPEGILLDRYTTDGVHLTPAAYAEWAKALLPLLPSQ